jgi:hypothetical protein
MNSYVRALYWNILVCGKKYKTEDDIIYYNDSNDSGKWFTSVFNDYIKSLV